MAIEFIIENNELILNFSPKYEEEACQRLIDENKKLIIKRVFTVSKQDKRSSDFDELKFAIGNVDGDYIKVNPEIVNTEHTFYFSKDINFKPNLFIAHRNISILRKIDKLIDRDFYVGGDLESRNGIPIKSFLELIAKFPNTTELNKYANSRITTILKEYFPECDKHEEIFKKYIENKTNSEIKESKINLKIELEQFTVAYQELKDLLKLSHNYGESVWQKKINQILQLLYPQYILCTREIEFKGIDGYDKRPDFLLIDTNGFVDILEIKKPEVPVLTKQASYRNNYVPVREFAGAIQQIEKYILCLTSIEKSRKDVIIKLKKLLPEGIEPQIIKPQGILIMGRSNDFSKEQKADFELIKRQYKNVTDILTYDDLISRINNIINSLKSRIERE